MQYIYGMGNNFDNLSPASIWHKSFNIIAIGTFYAKWNENGSATFLTTYGH